MSFVSRGFGGHRRTSSELGDRLPPGQYVERGFPVLTAGPTPRIETSEWALRVDGMVGTEREWSWDEFAALPHEDMPHRHPLRHQVVEVRHELPRRSLDVLLGEAHPDGGFAMAYSYGGYTTNVPIPDLTGGKAWVVTEHDGGPLPREHGGPARLLVPHLYFWKSAKWIAGIRVMDHDEPGFWEDNGYHIYGDPWKEQRYWTD